jgi:RNA polymerase sigma-70 factor (ECF subfamily)
MRTEKETGESGARGFATTHWSAVVQAGRSDSPLATQALEVLCRAYWAPLNHYIRQRGYGWEDARDLTQSFFCELLQKNFLRAANRQRGKFRTFLLTALKHFLAHEWEKRQAHKRGGQIAFVPFEEDHRLHSVRSDRPDEDSPERSYDRNWALAVFEQALARLREEQERAGRLQHFDRLNVFLCAEPTGGAYAQAAFELGMSSGAVTVAVHRLRQSYGRCARQVVAETVSRADQVEDELRYLISLIRP